jgi:hypothetical protein
MTNKLLVICTSDTQDYHEFMRVRALFESSSLPLYAIMVIPYKHVNSMSKNC